MILFVSGKLLGVKLEVTAEYRTDGPLRFTATTPPGSRLELADLVEALPLGGFRLPPGLPRLALENLALAFESGSSAFSLSGDVSLGLEEHFSVMGVNFGLPQDARLHVALVRTDPPSGGASTTLTLDLHVPKDQGFVLSSNLAWERPLDGGPHREMQNDEAQRDEDLISLSLKPQSDVALTLLDTTLGAGSSTRYLTNFRQEVADDAEPGPAVLDFSFRLNPGAAGFEFPFLKADAVEGVAGMLGQRITLPDVFELSETITIPAPKPVRDLDATSTDEKNPCEEGDICLGLDLNIDVEVGSIKFGGRIPVQFNLTKFALKIDHRAGIQLLSNQDHFGDELLGLQWTFRGKPQKDHFHYFTLVTENMDYQLQLAQGASVELAYGEISQEPIVFRVAEFILSKKGLTLAADVADDPVRLNGLDTKFRFGGSQLRIVENVIQDLTIAGSGALPPDLVGEAVADVALQFKQVQGGLRLIAGTAQLRGDKPLDCRGTRFQFSIDALGLKFVYDQKFHLYFTLSGQARFVPNPADDKDGPLALLPEITLQLVDCPLTGDASVIAQHIDFLVELPTPLSFDFLGAYGFELRAIGFQPQSEKFGGRGAMLLSGQVMFAQGKGDVADPDPELHKLYIGLPPKGGTKPQVDMGSLPVAIKAGEKFKLSGSVAFKYDDTMQGFTGDGVLEIKGLPPMAAAFGFMRVRHDAAEPWVRAWFIYLEVRQISFQVPVLQFYIREVGLGFGYRFTLVAIKEADEAGDLKELISRLKEVSRTQGDLSKKDRWSVDLEKPGQDPRWTIVLRAMISQMSAAPSPLTWNLEKERALSNTFLFDAVIAVRSDLTFFMAVRGWLNTNYGTFVQARNDNKPLAPLVSGFVFLWPREKRFLAHLASNPGGHLGTTEYPLNPPLPPFVVEAVRHSQFSATLLIEPGLMHYELGWPNMLRWSQTIGPLTAEIRGGFIFRISTSEMIVGVSLLARARLAIKAEINLGLVGASLTAVAEAAFGARYIGLLPFDSRTPAMYGALGLELRIQIALALWIKIPLIFTTIKLSFSFSFQIGFTAGLEVALYGAEPGLRGQGTVSLAVMGHSLQFDVRLEANAGAVDSARAATEKYMQMGLEATDVETRQPGIDDGRALPAPDMPFALAAREPAPAFSAPGYSVFVLREGHGNGHTYFVLLPRGQDETGAAERGFLPVPPAKGIDAEADFRLNLPDGGQGIKRFDPLAPNPDDPWVDATQPWKVNWGAEIIKIDEVDEEYELPKEKGGEIKRKEQGQRKVQGLTLRDYLRQAFLTENGGVSGGEDLADVVPTGDPEPIHYDPQERLEDPRVQNPSDDAFEAAVRGAVEQFAGSPFFKHDPNYAYDQALQDAFRPDTTVYTAGGQVPDEKDEDKQAAAVQAMEAGQQAHQVRGLVIHKLIDDVRCYAADGNGSGQTEAQKERAALSIPFQMGLVFQVPSDKLPGWLQDPGAEAPTLEQRREPGDTAPTSSPRPVETFNLRWTDFGQNPPQFRRVQHYTDANTIAITWDLAWEGVPEGITGARRDPEHHLQYYHVRRRPLDGRTPEVVYQVKPVAVLRREEDGLLKSLKPRFQVVDHFNTETLEQQAGLPVAGRSYLYTVTPVDQAGRMGQPLSLVATRYPNEPPRVPADGELRVEYQLPAADSISPALAPQAVEPVDLEVTWSEPSSGRQGLEVPIKHYYLILRRESTLPVGSYGLDSSTQRARTGLLPTSNARPLPADVKILLTPEGSRGSRSARRAKLHLGEADDAPLLDVLHRAGVFPDGDEGWRPESWRLYFQAVSANGVPSALAPVQLLLRARPAEAGPEGRRPEERRPAELEWLSWPVTLPLLPPEDQAATSSLAHLPMPTADGLVFRGQAGDVVHQTHPRGQRCLRFRWNQGPSGQPDYPLALTAGYELLELDVDAHTDTLYQDAARLNRALRRIQEVQMLPADDVWLVPGDTLSPNEWEAWYASAILRRRPEGEQAVEGATVAEGPWYSWRESVLTWPRWPGLTDLPAGTATGARPAALHPLLQAAVQALAGRPLFTIEHPGELCAGPLPASFGPLGLGEGWKLGQQGEEWWILTPGGKPFFRLVREGEEIQVMLDTEQTYTVDLQTSPPFAPQDLAGFLQATAPDSDPYGWNVLQRFGLSVAFSLRRADTGRLIVAEGMLAAVEGMLQALQPAYGDDFYPHLHVELLFQPNRRVELEEVEADAGALLGFLQLSLRPAIAPVQDYRRVEVQGPAGEQVHLAFNLEAPCSLLDQGNPAAGQVELKPGATNVVRRSLALPAHGQDNVLLRGRDLPAVAPLRKPEDPLDADSLVGAGGIVVLGAVGSQVALIFESAGAATVSNVTDPADTVPALAPDGGKAVVRHSVQVPDSGRVVLQVEGSPPPAVQLRLDESKPQPGVQIVQVHDMAVTDPLSVYFSQSPEALAAAVAAGGSAGEGWQRLRRYAESLTPPGSDEKRIQVATDEAGLEAQLADVMPWAQRFFDAAGPVEDGQSGPWLATAYPRAATPAQVAPDAAGRLTYDHLLQDRWAHNYRYYLRPYDRYRLLWLSLLAGEGAGLPALAEAQPDPQAGGLDVVLDRTQPVDRPLVLSSARLDPPGLPGQPVPPGSTWEVIVARHAEQALVERNQTLARQLAFRQVAFTLLRRFAYADWPAALQAAIAAAEGGEHEILLKPVADVLPKDVPEAYPDRPDHVALEEAGDLGEATGLDDAVARSLDLPTRIGNFQQGALVLQWEGLPFYYEHRLLLVAQTTGTVSPLNEVTQRDLEYRSPDPNAEGRYPDWDAPLETRDDRSREWRLPLLRFWDSLPATAQAQWPFEAPKEEDRDKRKPSSLPDPEVVYQLLELYEGNAEVQAEFNYDLTTGRYAVRQLGQRVVATLERVLPPEEPQGDYHLQIRLEQQNQVRLQGALGVDNLPQATRSKVKAQNGRLIISGVLDASDLESLQEALGDDRDRKAVAEIFGGWYAEEAFLELPDLEQLPDEAQELRAKLDSPRTGALRYHGVMTVAEAQALLALTTTEDDGAAVQRLYQRSAARGLGGSEWRILTRRGAAAPSPTRRLDAIDLEG